MGVCVNIYEPSIVLYTYKLREKRRAAEAELQGFGLSNRQDGEDQSFTEELRVVSVKDTKGHYKGMLLKIPPFLEFCALIL